MFLAFHVRPRDIHSNPCSRDTQKATAGCQRREMQQLFQTTRWEQPRGISQPWGWIHEGLAEVLGRGRKNHKPSLPKFQASPLTILMIFLPCFAPRHAKFRGKRAKNSTTKSSLLSSKSMLPSKKTPQNLSWLNPHSFKLGLSHKFDTDQ